MLRALFPLKSITMKNGCLLCDKILTIHLIFSEATHLDKQFSYSYMKKKVIAILGGGVGRVLREVFCFLFFY